MSEIRKAMQPAPYPPSQWANECEKHFWELDGMASVNVKELFPSMTPAIYNHGDDLKIVEKATRESLKNVDMSMIKPEDTVHITASEHGFGIMGGLPYLTMIRTIKEEIEKRTGNYRSKVILAMYRLPQESVEVKEYFELEQFLGCEVIGTCPFEEGVEIQTKIGKFYGNKLVYDCDWLIYAYYDDPREQYLHRGMNRVFKSFVMNFGRVETRCSFHMLSSTWNNSVMPQAIYDSDFVQERWGFACIMNTSPLGIYDICSSNDLYECEKYTEVHMLKDYTAIRLLFKELDPWIAVWDGGKWGSYLHTAGMIYGCCSSASNDYFDVDIPYSMATEKAQVEFDGRPKVVQSIGAMNTMKAVVMNQSWVGLYQRSMPFATPFYCVGEGQKEMFAKDRINQGSVPGTGFADGIHAVVPTLEEALELATKETECENYIAFDGSFEYINCSRKAAEDIIRKAEGVEEEVFNVYLPKYLRQRGMDIKEIYRNYYNREYKG